MKAFLVTIALLTFPFLIHAKSKALPEIQKVQEISQYKPHIGLLLGPIYPEGPYRTGGELGVDIGFQPIIPLSVGLELSRSEIETLDSSGSKIIRNNALAKFSYNFGGSSEIIKNSYVGLGFGLSMLGDESYFVGSSFIGVDLPLSDKEKDYSSFGIVFKYMIYEDSLPNYLTLGFMIKRWF